MSEQQPAQLRDVLNYDPEDYLTEADKSWIRATFKDNPRAIQTIRKLFLPNVLDLPVEEMTNDVWFQGGVDWASMPAEHAHQLVVARQDTIKRVMNGLVQLKMYANLQAKTPDQVEAEAKKNSSK